MTATAATRAAAPDTRKTCRMNTSMPLDAALTALTVLTEHLNDGFTADPARLRTAAEIACTTHGLPENQGPAIAKIASFWIAVAGGYVPASPGSSDPESDNLASMWRQPDRQARDLHRATWMIRQWRAYHDLADGPAHRAAEQRRDSSGSARRTPPADPAAPRQRDTERLYRVVQYYDSWPFKNDSRVPLGSNSHKRTDTFRTFGPVRQRLARANGLAQYQRQNGGDWSAFVAIAEQLTDDGWQPIERGPPPGIARPGTSSRLPDPPPANQEELTSNPPNQRQGEQPAMTAHRIDYDKMTGLVNARPDRGTRHALYTALTGINDAERTMRENITALRAALDDAETYIHATRTPRRQLPHPARRHRPRPRQQDPRPVLGDRRRPAHRRRDAPARNPARRPLNRKDTYREPQP